MKKEMVYEIMFDEESSGFFVNYSDILVDDLIIQVEHLRQYHKDGSMLWLRQVEEGEE